MRTIREVPFVAALICFCFINHSRAQCLQPYSNSDRVEINVVFEFQNSQYQTDRIYNSLEPKLKLPGGNEETRPETTRRRDERLETVFCVDASDVPPLNSKFVVKFGPRRLTISSRPITWSETSIKDRKGKNLREGKMSTIYLLGQAEPNWPMFQSARLLKRIGNNKWTLEVIVDNKSDHAVALEKLQIDATHPPVEPHTCGAPDDTQQVTLSWQRIISGVTGSAWTTFGDSTVAVKVYYQGRGRCSPFTFKADIPIRQTVPARQIIRVELRINEIPIFGSGISSPPSLVFWKDLEIHFFPEIYPSWVVVDH